MEMKTLMTVISIFFASTAFADFDWKEAEKEIKFLKPDASVPENVKKAIEDQGCAIPQTYIEKKPHNIIQGHFANEKSKDWAVLCSKEGKSSIFVVWEKEKPCPAILASGENKNQLQQISSKQIGFSRYLSSASKDVILKHQQAFGGPLPKKLDHQGIDDAFLEKASVTYYCEGGKWLALQGAD
jgi:hypothetical protein